MSVESLNDFFSPIQHERYARQFVLKEIGMAGQKKLLESRVLVAGAGALGSACMIYLASAGVGTIGISDFDVVALSNLQRQIIHTTNRIGMPKTESAKEAIWAINPDVQVVIHNEMLTADNILQIIADYDFILDCTDRFPAKFLINDACVLQKKSFCHAGVLRFGGQVMTYVPDKGPCLRCLLGEMPKSTTTCAEVGVIGAAAGIIGDIQALEAIKYLTGIGKLLTGRIFYFDGLEMDIHIMKYPHTDKNCPVCGEDKKIRHLNPDNYE